MYLLRYSGTLFYRDVAQLVARLPWEQEVAGSSPVIPTKPDISVFSLKVSEFRFYLI